jgi:hypothetical protein
MMGGCAVDGDTGNDRACLEAFIDRWGSRVMRAPLDPADVAFYADIAGDTPVDRAAVADVITVLLNAPQTLYRVESGADDSSAWSALTPFELAARVSYVFTDGPPDDQLWAAAEDGSLTTPEVYRREVTRILESPAARETLDTFVGQWLRLEELPPFEAVADDPVFVAFAGQQPAPTTRDAMIDDVRASLWHTLANGGGLSDFLRDRNAYATDDYLAEIYGVARWDGAGEPPVFPSAERSGLLTRAALLATGTATTRPIHKGYVIRNAVLCQQVGAPPPNVDAMPPESSEDRSTREAVTALTGGGVCGTCHSETINPPGFITERFDALGRERTVERLFDAEGNETGTVPVDTSTVPGVRLGDDRVMDDANEITEAIDESELFHSCFVRHYFRFAEARVETPEDGCLLADLETAARGGAPLTEVMLLLAESETFKTRRFE